MARFAKLGIGANRPFDARCLAPPLREAIQAGMADAWKTFMEFKATQLDAGKLTSADGFGSREFLKNDYLKRMASAALGIYGDSKEEAIYPSIRGTVRSGTDGRDAYHPANAPAVSAQQLTTSVFRNRCTSNPVWRVASASERQTHGFSNARYGA